MHLFEVVSGVQFYLMEQLLAYSLLFCSLFLLFILSIIFVNHKIPFKSTLKLPPGPWTLPMVGNLQNLIGSPPHHALRDLSRRFGPIMLLRLGEIPMVVVSSAESAKQIMKHHDITFATRPITPNIRIITDGGKGIVFSPYGEYWRQLRKICIIELLSTKRVQSFRFIREEEVGNMIREISACASRGQPVNLSKRLAIIVNDMAARIIIGSKCKDDQDVFLRVLDAALDVGSGFSLTDLFPSSRIVSSINGAARKAKRCRQTIDRVLDRIIKQHRENKAINEGDAEEDLVGVLLKIYDEGTLKSSFDMETVKRVIFDVFGVGSETSSTTLGWAMAELIRNPIVMKKAQSEIRELLKGCAKVSELDLDKLNYLHLVIKETLRLHPPAPLLLPRRCQETCRISGYDIPQGATVVVNVWAIGRDPKYWDDPEEFKPERFIDNNVDFKGTDFEFLPFGAGRRMCPGLTFGLANVELPLASLLYHFDWKLPNRAGTKEIDMSESFGITARKKIPLNLLAVLYKSGVGI